MQRRALIAIACLFGCQWNVVIGSDGLPIRTDDAGVVDGSGEDVIVVVDVADAGGAGDVVAVDRVDAADVVDVPDAVDARDVVDVPVDVPEIPTGTIRSVALGGDFTCVLRSDDSVWCRGDNTHGALGTGASPTSRAEVRVRGLGPVASMVAGRQHACAVLTAGGVRCWGANDRGQLGDGTTTDRATPVTPTGVGAVDGVSAGASHTCVRSGEVVRCTGANDHGQLGDGTGTDRSTFVAVIGTYRRVEAGGAFTLAETAAGMLVAWGANDHGQLGDGTTVDRPTPGAVMGAAAEARVLAVGDAHAFARAADGTTFVWGDNAQGALGDGTNVDRRTPVAVATWRESTVVRAGRGFTCADASGVFVRCCGANDRGQVGDGSGLSRNVPVGLTGAFPRGAGGFKVVGFDRACAVVNANEMWCWGDNALGQLGPAAGERQLDPTLVGR